MTEFFNLQANYASLTQDVMGQAQGWILLFLALASRAGNFKKLLAQTSLYLPNIKCNNDLFEIIWNK